ncbi:MAG: GGDEF domain-containing protein [Gemmatimonadales bacterium]
MSAPIATGSYLDTIAPPPLWGRPDAALAAAGVEGELVVARVRVVAMGFLMIAPTWNVLRHADEAIHITGFSVTLAASIAAVLFWLVIRRGRWAPWLGFASSAFDVSMVSTALVSFLLVGSPLVALNSKETFEMYFLAIVATSLRYDARVCLVAGALAVLQYGGLWAWSALHYDLTDPAYQMGSGSYVAVDLATRLILLAIATLLAVTIVRRAQRLLYLASHDRLTGLFNRGYFDRVLEKALDAARRQGQPLSVAILDLDRFKQVNDEHGHTTGDQALCQVAQFIFKALRRTDVVARYGGEEFVILLPGTPRDAAVLRVEALRQELAATPIELGTVVLAINFSAGVAGIPADPVPATGKALITCADQRLLAAKRSGRGRCIGEEQPVAAAASSLPSS